MRFAGWVVACQYQPEDDGTVAYRALMSSDVDVDTHMPTPSSWVEAMTGSIGHGTSRRCDVSNDFARGGWAKLVHSCL